MKQNKLKTLALALALALVLTLAVCMLVACNPKDDNTTGGNQNTPAEDGNNPSVLAKIFSEEQFNAIVGYLYSADLGKNGEAISYFFSFSENAVEKRSKETDVPVPTEAKNGALEVLLQVNNDYDEDTHSYSVQKTALIAYMSSPEEATKMIESLKRDGDIVLGDGFEEGKIFESTIGNIAVVESEKGLFENYIVKATIPSKVSDKRRQVLKQYYDTMKNAYFGMTFFAATKAGEEIIASFEPEHGNCVETLVFESAPDAFNYIVEELKDFQEYFEKFFTDDSYFDINKEDGYIFEHYKYKPGFVYDKEENGKLIIDEYYSAEDIVENLMIPAKLDGKNIDEVRLDSYKIGIKNISFADGITQVQFDNYATENVKLPSSITSVSLNCPNLKTVNYAGSTADFETNFGEMANSWCHVNIGYDSATHESIYKDITITVVCKDGTLTYPKNNAQA